MQTFLPYASFARTARVLDARRLGKQRVEALQILRALELEDYGWRNHPAVCMWRGYEDALAAYGVAIGREWIRRGFRDTCIAQIVELAPAGRALPPAELRERMPPWMGWRALHRSHQSALVRKEPEHYRPLFPGVPDDLPYVWPEPCAPAAPRDEPRSAWVVRAPSPDVAARFRASGCVALPPLELGKRRAGKGQRQIDAFIREPSAGDAVVLPLGDRLLVGEITSDYRHHRRATLPHVRSVRWIGELARSALRRPGRLQDPRQFFALRGELDPRALFERSVRVAPRGSRRS